jgi:hypothetical protein
MVELSKCLARMGYAGEYDVPPQKIKEDRGVPHRRPATGAEPGISAPGADEVEEEGWGVVVGQRETIEQ